MKPNLTYIIDDDKLFTYILSKQMKKIDFCEELVVFHNGQQAINRLQSISHLDEQLPDIIILDLNMPVMDGWEFLDEFIKFHINKRILVYIVSSSINNADYDRASGYSAVSQFYVKPISQETLLEMLK